MSYIRKSLLRISVVTGFVISISGCAAVQSTHLAYRCNSNISTVSAELEKAKKDGYSHSISWSRAASLIAAAKIQQQTEEFPNCINKAAQARYYINRSLQVSSI